MFDRKTEFVKRPSKNTPLVLGRQLCIEYYDCNTKNILDKDLLEKALLKAARNSGASIISSSFNQLEPQGVSGVVIIAESHFTIHTWPEHDYAAVDMFSCADHIDLAKAVDSIKQSLSAKNTVISSDLNRGFIKKAFEQYDMKDLKNHQISWKTEFEKGNLWGMSSSVDIYNSDSKIIRDKKKIEEFIHKLCDLLGMRRFGECQIVDFGEDERIAGFSMTQLIETSLISGHFANASNTAYLDIFSCKEYEPREAAEFATEFFKGEYYKLQISLRR